MTAIFWIAILITCAASIGVAYLVAADFWRDQSPSSRERAASIARDAHDAAERLTALYHQALRDIRRR
ncbi:hypothetical protein [Paenarthrobacter sp. JL.01a]|uniref:hypothetical protein n=1 Tax=Paenarthrobacter sp. JL.01a TaxID=2979324 RepID=UPI0021C73EC5|nr:hypothetical protein [Paenarthrobacter sp. JL.01a]UXM91007.1 hypothetical protein N5P29_17165 [Paenarthrobacter sp. JL.01a]